MLLLAGMLMMSPAFAADDDSTPYMPYTETPQPAKPAPAPAKKPAPKKKAPAKKTPAKKQTAKKAAPKAPARPSSLQQGIALMQAEKYEQAKPYLLKAIQENRNDPNAWYWYGMYHEKTGGFYQAQYFYSKAVTLDPAFEPLSRVVYYPEDSEKTPLWDPKRPARVYPVEVASTGGVSGVPASLPGRSSFPEAPNDPELPHVPVYTPPEPGSAPFDGDAWNPAVYVPPRPEEVSDEGAMSPQYVPPQPQSITAQNPQTQPSPQVIELPMSPYPEGTQPPQPQARAGNVVRADKPVYNPPNPGEKAPTPPKQTPAPKKQTKTPAKSQVNAPQTGSQRTASVPNNRVVRQSTKKTAAKKQPAPAKTPTPTPAPQRRQTASRDVRPQTPQTTQPSTRQPQTRQRTPEPTPRVQTPEPETQRQPQTQEQNYIPPFGQQTPDPGTLPENPIPPVGQGSQY